MGRIERPKIEMGVHGAAAEPPERQMTSSRSEEHLARPDDHTVFCLHHLECRHFIEFLSVQSRIAHRHVQHDRHWYRKLSR